MTLKLIKDYQNILEFENELSTIFTSALNEHKLVKVGKSNSNFPVQFSKDRLLWFNRSRLNDKANYQFGNVKNFYNDDKNHIIKNYLEFNIFFKDTAYGNCRFAIDDKTDVKYILLECETTKKIRNKLRKRFNFNFVSIKNENKSYFKIELEQIVNITEILISSFELEKLDKGVLRILRFNNSNLKKNFNNINQNKTPNNILAENKLDTKNNIKNNVTVDTIYSSNSIDKNQCNICSREFSENDFRKIGEGFSKICKSCEYNQISAQNLKELLEHINPSDSFTVESLNDKFDFDLYDLKDSLLENDLIYENESGDYVLYDNDTLNNFINRFTNNALNNQPKNNKNTEIEEDEIPKKKSNGQYSKYTGVSFNRQIKKWFSYVFENGKNVNLGYFETEQEAYAARKEKLSEKNINKKEIKTSSTLYNEKSRRFENGNNMIKSEVPGITYEKKKWRARAYIDGKEFHVGYFNTENEAIKEKNNFIKHFNNKNENLKNNSSINFFINEYATKSEILVKGILPKNDVFDTLINLKEINSEISKITINDVDNHNADLFIEIKQKRFLLDYITDLLKDLGWNELKFEK